MDEQISVTEAARNFADCVNRSHYQNVSFVLLKNGVPFARLVPAEKPPCSAKKLAAVVAALELSEEEVAAWNRDRKAAHKILKPPKDRW